MGLFGRRKKKGESKKTAGGAHQDVRKGVHPVVGRRVYCKMCQHEQMFTRCWRRVEMLRQCPCCGKIFENPAALYKRHQPACHGCGEFLEQPGFDYGLCDGCGTKYELVEGAKPGLLPNRQQRAEMEKHGKSWSKF